MLADIKNVNKYKIILTKTLPKTTLSIFFNNNMVNESGPNLKVGIGNWE